MWLINGKASICAVPRIHSGDRGRRRNEHTPKERKDPFGILVPNDNRPTDGSANDNALRVTPVPMKWDRLLLDKYLGALDDCRNRVAGF